MADPVSSAPSAPTFVIIQRELHYPLVVDVFGTANPSSFACEEGDINHVPTVARAQDSGSRGVFFQAQFETVLRNTKLRGRKKRNCRCILWATGMTVLHPAGVAFIFSSLIFLQNRKLSFVLALVCISLGSGSHRVTSMESKKFTINHFLSHRNLGFIYHNISTRLILRNNRRVVLSLYNSHLLFCVI